MSTRDDWLAANDYQPGLLGKATGEARERVLDAAGSEAPISNLLGAGSESDKFRLALRERLNRRKEATLKNMQVVRRSDGGGVRLTRRAPMPSGGSSGGPAPSNTGAPSTEQLDSILKDFEVGGGGVSLDGREAANRLVSAYHRHGNGMDFQDFQNMLGRAYDKKKGLGLWDKVIGAILPGHIGLAWKGFNWAAKALNPELRNSFMGPPQHLAGKERDEPLSSFDWASLYQPPEGTDTPTLEDVAGPIQRQPGRAEGQPYRAYGQQSENWRNASNTGRRPFDMEGWLRRLQDKTDAER